MPSRTGSKVYTKKSLDAADKLLPGRAAGATYLLLKKSIDAADTLLLGRAAGACRFTPYIF